MKKYLIDLTFYAGSDSPEDTDRKLYLLWTRKAFSRQEMAQVIGKVNRLMDPYSRTGFPVSYHEGLNSDTLMRGVSRYLEGRLSDAEKYSGRIDAIYNIEQWQ